MFFRPPDALKDHLLEKTEQFHLELGRQFADLVQEQRSVVGVFHLAAHRGNSSGEGPPLMAKKIPIR